MPNCSVVLTEQDEIVIARLIESGRYLDADAVLREGLRLLERRHATMNAPLVVSAHMGLANVDQGRGGEVAGREWASDFAESERNSAGQLLARLLVLHERCRPDEPWRIVLEPHDYPDGTTHFTHVRTTGYMAGEAVEVLIAQYLTPELAELLVLMRNNLPQLIQLAEAGMKQ